MTDPTDIQIAIPLFDRWTALDGIGPYEVLQRLPGASVVFVGQRLGEHRTDNGFLGAVADATFDQVPRPDVVVVPGGIGTREVIRDEHHPLLDWLRRIHPTTRQTTSVCTGSLLLARAGLLHGRPATTHWGARQLLTDLGAVLSTERVVELPDDRIITAAGVSAGIDMALRLAELLVDTIAAQAMQLAIEYDPRPPFDAGSIERAGEAVVERLASYPAR